MSEITALDYLLLPFYIWLIYKVALYCRDKYYPQGHPFRPYFMPGMTIKIAGAIFIGLVYKYYYDGGDTFNYFFHSRIINSTLTQSPPAWLRLLTHRADESNLVDARALSEMYWYDDIPAYTTSCLGALIGIFCFTKYLLINVLIAAITFIGVWLMFVTFALQYPSVVRPIAIAVLFMPGPVVWGSGLFKDSFCLFSIGCLVYCTGMLLEKRRISIRLMVLALVSIGLLWLIKAYILVVLLPLLIFKTILVYKKRAALNRARRFSYYLGLGITLFVAFVAIKEGSSYLTAFTTENVLETVTHQKDYLLSVSLETDGSAYDLGDFDPTLAGMSGKILPAINVTLFRPYLWESRSAIQLFNALESTVMLLLSLYLIARRNVLKTIIRIYRDPNLVLCLAFSLVFAFFVGISSYNFGTLSRYKIPCTPFYMLFLVILIFNNPSTVKDPQVLA